MEGETTRIRTEGKEVKFSNLNADLHAHSTRATNVKAAHGIAEGKIVERGRKLWSSTITDRRPASTSVSNREP
jgi:hypothetical protein